MAQVRTLRRKFCRCPCTEIKIRITAGRAPRWGCMALAFAAVAGQPAPPAPLLWLNGWGCCPLAFGIRDASSVLCGELSPTSSELGNHRSSPGVDSAARRLATQLNELAVDPAPPMDCDGGVLLGELRRAADLAPPSNPVAELRRRRADALRTDKQLKASRPTKRRPRAACVDASAGTGSTYCHGPVSVR